MAGRLNKRFRRFKSFLIRIYSYIASIQVGSRRFKVGSETYNKSAYEKNFHKKYEKI